ncbi:MAG TPA: LON peptidase substrate-binding domain-containing protein [Gemmatimonadota bacterium]|nr:LON peptidase substrate-binding domain-containing protein [Gemmatimonadota bacterium]
MNAAVFPLPNVVFFPDTFLPLHVFEPRYRVMTEEAIAGDRTIVVVLARAEKPPGEWPAIHPIGTLGRIEVAEPRPDGRWHIALRGLTRVRIGTLRERPGGWFEGQIEAVGETLPDLQDPRVAERKARLLLTARRYDERILEGRHAEEYLTAALPFPTAVNRAASILRIGVNEKQDLLAMGDLEERARAVEEVMVEQVEAREAVERFAARRPENSGSN